MACGHGLLLGFPAPASAALVGDDELTALFVLAVLPAEGTGPRRLPELSPELVVLSLACLVNAATGAPLTVEGAEGTAAIATGVIEAIGIEACCTLPTGKTIGVACAAALLPPVIGPCGQRTNCGAACMVAHGRNPTTWGIAPVMGISTGVGPAAWPP